MRDFIEKLTTFFSSERGENFLIGLIATLAGAFITWGASVAYKWYRSTKSLLTGTWLQIINDEGIEKQDEVFCRQVGDNLSGTIKRTQPDDQSQKRWKFIGRIHGEKVFIIFWSANPRVNPDSYGTIQFHVKSDVELHGLYVKAVNEPVPQDHEQHLSTFRTISIIWKIIK